MKRWHVLSLAAITVGLLAGLLPAARFWESEPAAAQQAVTMSLDMDTTDGPCTDIDAATTHSVGDIYSIAVCVSGLSAAIGTLGFDVLYDDLLNYAPEVADSGVSLDDNPDANAGTTTWGDGLGEGWDCSSSGLAFPVADRDPDDGPGQGDAFLVCSSLIGPFTLGDDETSGVLAVISFATIAGGTDTLSIANGLLGDEFGTEIGTCNPDILFPMTCNGGSETKSGTPPAPTATSTGTPTPTPTRWCGGPGQPPCPTSTPTPKAWTMTPTAGPTETPTTAPPAAETPVAPPPPPPPTGGEQPVVVPPPTGQGGENAISPVAAVFAGIGLAGVFLVGTGVVLRRARSR